MASTQQIRIIGPRTLVEMIEKDEVRESGLIVAGKDKDVVATGEVLDVGQFKDGEEPHFTIGDKILYNKYSAIKLTVNGNDYYAVATSDVFAVVS